MNIERVKKVKRSKAFTIIDIIVVAVLAVSVALSVWLIYRTPAATVSVSAPDCKREFALDSDTVIQLEHLTVHIEGGAVWVTDADCRDRTCEHTGRITRAGQSIVCLPNDVVITINGNGDLAWEVGR